MYRKRRKIRYYNGAVPKERLTGKPWFPFVTVALVAAVLALIVGAILGGVADKSSRETYEPKSLYDFGGVEDVEEKFASVVSLDADYMTLRGKDDYDARVALSDIAFGDGAVFLLYDGAGNVYYRSELVDNGAIDLDQQSDVSLSKLAERGKDKGIATVGVFVSTAFLEADEGKRILQKGQELAILSEIASARVRELLIVGLPSDEAMAEEVNAYLRNLYGFFHSTRVGVLIEGKGSVADIARAVNASQAYVDYLCLDLRGLADEELTEAIEANAYYLTYYKMRVLFDNREQYELISSYDVTGSMLFEWAE